MAFNYINIILFMFHVLMWNVLPTIFYTFWFCCFSLWLYHFLQPLGDVINLEAVTVLLFTRMISSIFENIVDSEKQTRISE